MKKNYKNLRKARPLNGISVSLDPKHTRVYGEEDIQESNDRLIKRFIKKVRKSEIIREVLDRRYFVKPSEKRHRHNRHLVFVRRKIAEEEKRLLFSQKNG